MNKLININSENNKQLVNARELYEFLEVGQEFATWIKNRISKYDFIESEDFTIDKFVNGKATQKDYIITLEMAKELSMVENNEKGKQARKYFIAVEKKFKESVQPKLSKELQAIYVLDQRSIDTNARLDNFENTMPLFNTDCKELQKLVRKIATKTLGGYRTPAYKNISTRTKVYKDIQGQLNREFGVERYESIKRVQIETAKTILYKYLVPIYLKDDIALLNDQIEIPFSDLND